MQAAGPNIFRTAVISVSDQYGRTVLVQMYSTPVLSILVLYVATQRLESQQNENRRLSLVQVQYFSVSQLVNSYGY